MRPPRVRQYLDVGTSARTTDVIWISVWSYFGGLLRVRDVPGAYINQSLLGEVFCFDSHHSIAFSEDNVFTYEWLAACECKGTAENHKETERDS